MGIAVVDIRDAERLFNLLEVKQQKNVLRSAIRHALKPILRETQANFKADFGTDGTGGGYKSLGVSMFRKSIGGTVGARLNSLAGELTKSKNYRLSNPGKSYVTQKYKGYYARYLDIGTAPRFMKTNKTGKGYRGRLKPSLFFSDPAFKREGKAAEDLANGVIYALDYAATHGRIAPELLG